MSDAAATRPKLNRGMITISIMLATVITALDTTIANVALPHISGSLSASTDQITWVLTSYIIATAITTPMSGWLTGRFGLKRVFVISIIGFTAASAMCGAAQTLEQIIVFRVLQGVFGATIMPLSQAVMFDIYPGEERGPAIGLMGMGVMVAPILGPVLGGWLTDNFSWRWVFYINLPLGVLSVLGIQAFFPADRAPQRLPFDAVGFGLLSLALASFQLMLDRGQTSDWFQSPEIVIEATVAAVTLVLFIIHTLTAERPLLPIKLVTDGNFVKSCVLGFSIGLMLFSVLALLPPMTQNLLGYPVVTAGVVMAPRGIGSVISMFVVGRMVSRVDNRVLIITGLALFATAFYSMSKFSLQMGSLGIATTGFIQGLGTGFVFMPMTVLGFATLDPSLRPHGAGFLALIRNVGNSAGISIMQAIFTRNAQVVHARLIEGLTPDNPLSRPPYLAAPFSLTDPGGVAALNSEVTRQASMVAYTDVFHLMFVTTVALAPLVLLMRRPTQLLSDEETLLMD